MGMAKIGATPKGGVCRLALSDLDKACRDQFIGWARAAGCAITVDRMGNIFARRDGTDPTLPPVLVGSHLDSQPTGGKFDGALGVLAGLEIVRSLNDLSISTKHPIEVVNWTNEEGSRFAPAMISSGVFAGKFTLEQALAITDAGGESIGEALQRIGYAGTADVGHRPLHAYFELHIEQGPILEDGGYDVGVVTRAQGQRWYDVRFRGLEAHAGPTPMLKRKDALLGGARVIELVNRLGLDHQPGACATVGMIDVQPNSRNVIPGNVFLSVDFRHPDDQQLSLMDQKLRSGAEAIAGALGLELDLNMLFHMPPLVFDETCVEAVRNAADMLGYRSREIVSGAGHDACYVASIAPTAMVFTPCVGGISHNESEDCRPQWVKAGADVLIHAVVDAAGIVYS